MGLFSFVGKVVHGATHLASDAWNGATDLAGDAVSGVESAAKFEWHGVEKVAGFLAAHWKTLAAVAIGTVAFVAVATFAPELIPGLMLAMGDAAPWAVLGSAGFASGAATRVFNDLIAHKTPGWDILKAGAITGVLTVASWGALRFAAPILSGLPVIGRVVTALNLGGVGDLARAGGAASEGAVSGSLGSQGFEGAIDRIETEPAGEVTATGGTAGETVARAPGAEEPGDEPSADGSGGKTDTPGKIPLKNALLRGPSKTRGLIGLLSGDAANKTNAHLNHQPLDPDNTPPPPPVKAEVSPRERLLNTPF